MIKIIQIDESYSSFLTYIKFSVEMTSSECISMSDILKSLNTRAHKGGGAECWVIRMLGLNFLRCTMWKEFLSSLKKLEPRVE